jgi:hypothetical protein
MTYLQVSARWDGAGWLWIDSSGLNGHFSPSPAQLAEEWAADDPHYPSLLDWFGEQGWELVAVLTGQLGLIDFIFKQPRVEDTTGSDDED